MNDHASDVDSPDELDLLARRLHRITVKAPLYARAGLPEHWSVDVNGRCVEVYRNPLPKQGRDLELLTLEPNDELSPIALPGPKLLVRDVLL